MENNNSLSHTFIEHLFICVCVHRCTFVWGSKDTFRCHPQERHPLPLRQALIGLNLANEAGLVGQ